MRFNCGANFSPTRGVEPDTAIFHLELCGRRIFHKLWQSRRQRFPFFPAGVRDEFYHVDLDHAFVSSYRVTTAADGTASQEFTVAFEKAQLTYRPQDDKGALGGEVKFGWNVATTETR